MVYLCDNCKRYPCTDDDYKMRYTCPGFLEKPKPTTNADRIRSMSDEELAKWIWTSVAWQIANYRHDEKVQTDDEWLEWLKEEVKE